MARPTWLLLTSLPLFALGACGGPSDGFFSNVASAGASSSSQAGAPSSAGSISSSGRPGNAGSPGSAGSPGPVQAGSGGVPSGGANSGGADGVSNSGGARNVAGASSGGSAGRGAGGSGAAAGQAGAKNTAGAGGSTPVLTCDELIRQANQQLDAARVCNLDADALQCTGKVANLCNCEVPVQRPESQETKAYLKTLRQIEDKDCAIACTAIVCGSVSNVQCRGSGSSATGTCVAANHGPDFD